MKSTITISELSDPEQAATYGIINNSGFNYRSELANQIKLNLLLSEHIYMPIGFILDNPALWDFFYDDAFIELLTPANKTLTNSLMSIGISFPNDYEGDLSFKEAFNFWRVGFSRNRDLRPCALRVKGVSSSMTNEQFNLWNDKHREKDVELTEYAETLGLKGLLRISDKIERVYEGSKKEFNPLNRHEILIKKVMDSESVDYYLSQNPKKIKFWKKLRNYINNNKLESISRSKIGNDLGDSIWQEVSPIINSWRSEGYIENVKSKYIPVSMTSNLLNIRLEAATAAAIEKCQKYTNFDTPNWHMAIEDLSFRDLIEIRKDRNFSETISKISQFQYSEEDPVESLKAHDKFVQKDWGPCLLDIITSINPGAVGLGAKDIKKDKSREGGENLLRGASLSSSLAGVTAATGSLLIPSLPFLSVAAGVGAGLAVTLLAFSRFQNYMRPTNQVKSTLIGQLRQDK